MRRVLLTAALVIVGALLLASVVLAEGEGTAEPGKGKVPPPEAEKIEAKEVAKEEASPVTATLTCIKNGEKQDKEVTYLPEGRKIATMETSKGTVVIELWEDEAPNTVINFVSLANGEKYDGVEFHRVIDGFMAQTGDVQHRKGTGGPGYTIPAEFSTKLKHERGVVSMARASDPDSGGSQFFIMFASSTNLDGKYAAFGKVIKGMDVVDSLAKGDGPNGSVSKPDKIITVRVESVPVEPVEPVEKAEEK